MIGAIIGDVVGSRFEFNNHLSTDFQLFAGLFLRMITCTVAAAYTEWRQILDKRYSTGV